MKLRGGKPKKKLGAGWIVLIVLACVGALIGTIMVNIDSFKNKDNKTNKAS